MLKQVVIGVVFIIALFLIVAAFQPGQFKIERTTLIHAAPQMIFAQIDDFHNWNRWSPWAKVGPQMKVIYSGKPLGIGAIYNWDGMDKVGAGRMEIMTSLPGKRVDIKMDFFRPFKGENLVEFVITPGPTLDTQSLSWAMSGPKPFMSKAMGLIFDLDKLVGDDFERGLQTLKQLCEASPLTTQ